MRVKSTGATFSFMADTKHYEVKFLRLEGAHDHYRVLIGGHKIQGFKYCCITDICTLNKAKTELHKFLTPPIKDHVQSR